MIDRLCGKKTGLAILVFLLIVSALETAVRAMRPGYLYAPTGPGEPFAIAIFVAVILFLALKGKDRACYICYGAFIGWFVLGEALSLPGSIMMLSSTIANTEIIAVASSSAPVSAITFSVLRILITICIVAIGALIVEYLNDGSIYNRAFNILCVVTALLLLVYVAYSVYNLAIDSTVELLLVALNSLYRAAMVFLFVFFAYDSAKTQLKKTELGV